MNRLMLNCIEFIVVVGVMIAYVLTLGVFTLYLNTRNPKLCMRLPGLFDAIRYRRFNQIIAFLFAYIIIIWSFLCIILISDFRP